MISVKIIFYIYFFNFNGPLSESIPINLLWYFQ